MLPVTVPCTLILNTSALQSCQSDLASPQRLTGFLWTGNHRTIFSHVATPKFLACGTEVIFKAWFCLF